MPAAPQAVEAESQAVRRGMWGRLMDYRRDHPRGWAFMAAALMGGLSLVIGLGTTIYDGALNKSTRPMLFFLAVGLGAFYLPGLLMGYAAFCLRRGRAVPVLLGSVAAAAQGVMAGVVTPGQFYFTSFELVPLVEGIAVDGGGLLRRLAAVAKFAVGAGRRGGAPRVRGGVGGGCGGGGGLASCGKRYPCDNPPMA